IVLGILSYNNAGTIGSVINAAQNGVSRAFPESRALIVHADGGSRDGTIEQAKAAVQNPDSLIQVTYPIFPVHRMIPDYPGVPGKGNALRAVFDVAEKTEARACVVIQSDVRSITPEWTEALVRPVLEAEKDYVAPLHQRHRYESTVLS